jgi:uncharacterized protein (TIGR00369 family)
MTEPETGNPCFGCGEANARGMHLRFDRDEQRQRIVGKFRLGPEYQGGKGFIHGGVIATVLDEVMSKVSRFSNVLAVTAELNVEYLKPIRVDQELVVEGFAERREGRQLYHKGEIRDAAGTLLARGRGRFVIIDPERYGQRTAGGQATGNEETK